MRLACCLRCHEIIQSWWKGAKWWCSRHGWITDKQVIYQGDLTK